MYEGNREIDSIVTGHKLTLKVREFLPDVTVKYNPRGVTSAGAGTIFMGKLGSTEEETMAILSHEMGHLVIGEKFPKAPTQGLRNLLRELDANMAGEKFALKWGVKDEYYAQTRRWVGHFVRSIRPKSLLLLPTVLEPHHVMALVRASVPSVPGPWEKPIW